MKTLILGAGAVGGYFGARLARAGLDVTLAARDKHLQAMRQKGLTVKTPDGTFTVQPPVTDEPGGKFDVAILAVKSYDTDEAARLWGGCFRDVVTIQNGLGNEERLASILGPERVIGGVAYIAAEVVKPGVIEHSGAGWIVIGEHDGSVTPRVEAVRDLFAKASMRCDVSSNVTQVLWEKLLANAVFNSTAAVKGCNLGDLIKPPHLETIESAIAELMAVAKAEGAEIRPAAREHSFEFCRNYPKFKTSTQQDVERGRRVEYEALNGEVVRRGKLHGIPTPTHEKLYELLKAKSG